MNLRKRILTGYGITLGLMAAVMVWAVLNLVGLGRANDNITIEGEADILKGIDEGYSAYLVAFSELWGALLGSEPDAGPFYHETVLPAFKIVRNACTDLREINQTTMVTAQLTLQRLGVRQECPTYFSLRIQRVP